MLVLIILLDVLLEHLPRGVAELYPTYRRALHAIATVVTGVIFTQPLASATWLEVLRRRVW
uniref:Uncharacterized protein n=1 Tax=Ignisphaera aggregans TaxID=334771 RepID=A0A7C4FCD1_9CREN